MTKKIDWIPGVGGPFWETSNRGPAGSAVIIRLQYHPDFQPEHRKAPQHLVALISVLFVELSLYAAYSIHAQIVT